MLTQNHINKIKENLEEISKIYDIAFEIYANNKSLVYYMPLNFPYDKENWLRRKRNTAKLFETDSLDIFHKNNGELENFYLKYGLSPKDYALAGGAVCIKNENNITVGYVTITGLAPEEDHRLAKEAIEKISDMRIHGVTEKN